MRIRTVILLGLGLFFLVIDPRWMPEVGIDPRAAVNGAVAVAMAVFILKSLHERLTRF